MVAYPFYGYWEDIGTIKSFFEENLKLTRHVRGGAGRTGGAPRQHGMVPCVRGRRTGGPHESMVSCVGGRRTGGPHESRLKLTLCGWLLVMLALRVAAMHVGLYVVM